MAQPAQLVKLDTPASADVFVLSKTGTVGAAVCGDKKLRVWSLPNGHLIRIIDLGDRIMDAMAISDDGTAIAIGDHAGRYTTWNVETGTATIDLRSPYYPFAIAFSPDGKRLAIAPVGQPVQIYDATSGKRLFDLQRVIGGTAAVVFSRDGKRIATADTDTVVRVYDGTNGELLARHTDFLLVPLAVTFTPDGKQVLTGGGDKIAALLDASTGRAIRKSEKLADPIAYVEFSPDGTMFATGLMHAANMLMPAPVVISEAGSGRKVFDWMPSQRVIGSTWTIDGHLIAATNADQGLILWQIR